MAVHAPPVDDNAVSDLQKQFRGTLLRPNDDGYDEARTIWNAMIDREPALIAQCASVTDVIASVNFATEHGLTLAVKGGGHNAAGNAVCDGGLVIDLSRMKSVRVKPETRTVRVEPGVLLGELDHETQAFGLATPAGIVSTTGVAGLTLGGGWGWLSRSYGLTIDNLRSADIVTADGELLHASEDENEDLFWGIRGGGGNFGIVTSFEFDCHKVGPEVLGGPIFHPFEDATDLLRFHREFTSEAPDELCCYVAITAAPLEPFIPEELHGTTVVAFIMCYSGPIEEGEQVVEPLREFGDPIADLVGPMPFTGLQQLFDEDLKAGARNYWKTQLVEPLSDEAIDIVVDRARTRPTPSSDIVLEHLGGAIARVSPDTTAFRHRDAAFSFNVFPRWTDPEKDEAHISWAQEFMDAIAPFASDGVAVNFLSQEGDERVKAAYGANYERLATLKNEYDPENLFQMNQNIEPSI
ncbi:FAD-binding oxidoreductase [Natrinema sp. SYSU A 869]|uniref:FAD-binding oxidoreductase n=1 Tax=Natrinema sp. SYSU A 869 TaxID=2871694 RepID=UPI001CA442BC|nr:FAD-binding oxidoreductase [Natrinema sp. SYSU A 869]